MKISAVTGDIIKKLAEAVPDGGPEVAAKEAPVGLHSDSISPRFQIGPPMDGYEESIVRHSGSVMDPASKDFDSWLHTRFSESTRAIWDAIAQAFNRLFNRNPDPVPPDPVPPDPLPPDPLPPDPVPPDPALPERDLSDPDLMGKHTQEDFEYWKNAQDELFAKDGPSKHDIHQAGAGDCYFLAALAAVAAQDPDAIRDMIQDNEDGTYSVRFFHESPSGSGDFQEVWIEVDKSLARNADGEEAYAQALDTDGDKREEIWVAIVEKAFAVFNDEYKVFTPDGKDDEGFNIHGYDDIGKGGWPTLAHEAISGVPFFSQGIPNVSNNDKWQLLSGANSGAIITAHTYCMWQEKEDTEENRERNIEIRKWNADLRKLYYGTGIASSHAYTVLGTEEENGEQYVLLRNPWGHGEPDNNGPNDGIFRITFNEFNEYYHFYHTITPSADTGPQQVRQNPGQSVGKNPGQFRPFVPCRV